MRKTVWPVCVVLCVMLGLCPSVFGARKNRPSGQGGQGQRPGPQGRSQKMVTGTAAKTFSGAAQSKKMPELSVQSSKADEAALRVQNGAKVSVNHLTINKKGEASSEESSNFYSLNAGVAVWKDSALTINGGRVETHGKGANAFVAYGTNAVLKVSNLEIYTTKSSSRGLHATFGGKIEGEKLKITTQGAHCAALATDRGGGTVIGRNIQAKTSGDGSPGIYSTGNITAVDSTFEATGSEAAVIEGKNTITVRNCTMIGHRRCGAMLYQSFSGDAKVGTCVYTMEGGSLTAKSGPVFYVTNTNAKVNMSKARLVSGNGVLIEAGSNRWGRRGKNGGHVAFRAESQQLTGDIVVNDISDVSLSLGQNTQLKGTINAKATAGKVKLELGKGAVWNVTGDSSVDSLFSDGQTLQDLRSKIISNGHVIHYRTKQGFLNGEKIMLDHGGMLVYTPAPKVNQETIEDPSQYERGRQRQGDGQRERGGQRGQGRRNGNRPPPPPDGFGGGEHREEPPPEDE